VLHAELAALSEGLSLALHWCTQPISIETDCLEMVSLLKKADIDRSVHSNIIEEIKALLKIRQSTINYVSRSQNTSSHFMANYARTSNRTAVWLASGPEGLDVFLPDTL
jgi:ribonuclease HI